MPASHTLTRVLTAAVLVPVVLAVVWWGPTWLIASAMAVIMLLALHEYFEIGRKLGINGAQIWISLAALWVVFSQWHLIRDPGSLIFTSPNLDWTLLVVVFGLILHALLHRRQMTERVQGLALSLAGFAFIAIPLSYVLTLVNPALMVRLEGVFYDVQFTSRMNDRRLLLFVLLIVWLGDTAAYFAGRAFGRKKLAPDISPGKTWEGAIANVAAAVVVGLLFRVWLDVSLLHLLAMSVIGSVAGQCGDLLESVYKRAANVKDSGALLPGHGGVLDRIDALIFAAPAIWVYVATIDIIKK